ncbi:hypothetical protein [Actinomadura sp. 9N215]|uniref:hypothetical protein n=1 Tax=Actinomadura sp. 9N215 TaxID=3375150 RepID=UPI00379E4F43
MNGERRVTVSGTLTVRARTLPDGLAAPPSEARPAEQAAAPAPSASDPQDPDPLHTGPPDADPPDADPPDADPPDADPPGTGPSDAGPSDTGPSDASQPAPVGAAAASALIRAQLRIALTTCAVVLTVVAGLPALLALVPAISRAGVRGVPLSWLVLVLGIQPLWVAVALRQLRRAERAERDLTAQVPCAGTHSPTPRNRPLSRGRAAPHALRNRPVDQA